MALTNEQITAQNFKDFYAQIQPYLNGSFPTAIVNKFSKGDLYSTDEKLIGRWIDSKPLYQRTLQMTMPTLATKYAIKEIEDCDVIFVVWAFEYSSNATMNVYPAYGSDAKLHGSVWTTSSLHPDGGRVILQADDNAWAGIPVYITVQYTKISDSPVAIGDGDDYSTTEKIVGTWIGGKPLYQCTYIATAKSDGTLFTFPNTYEICNFFGIVGGGESLNCSYDSSHYVFTSIDPTNHLVFQKVAGYIGQTEYVTLQYTKTTD